MTYNSVYGGLFQDPTFLTTDPDKNKTDPYEKEEPLPSRYVGKQMKVPKPSPGPHPDCYFERRFLTLASATQNEEGEQILNKKSKSKKKKGNSKKLPEVKPIADKEFRYASFPQQSTGPGSFYGCFQDQPFEYMTEPWVDPKAKKKKSKKKKEETPQEEKILPNIKTNPTKIGTYGMPGLLLEKQQYNEQWKAEIDALNKAEEKRKKNMPPPPKSMGGPLHISGINHKFFDEQPGTGAPAVFNSYEPAAVGKKKHKPKKEAAPPKPLHDKPFKLSTAQTGEEGYLSTFPNSWVNPDAPTNEKGKKKKKKEKEPETGALQNVPQWRPNSFEKTSIVSSCLRRFY
eukprot:gene2343-1473_t